jgi:hypothetical protein
MTTEASSFIWSGHNRVFGVDIFPGEPTKEDAPLSEIADDGRETDSHAIVINWPRFATLSLEAKREILMHECDHAIMRYLNKHFPE